MYAPDTCTINLCAIYEESNSTKVHKMSIQSLWHIHLSLCHTINLCAISEESNSKKFTKCQYNLCGIYIYLCAILSISAHSPRNQTEKVHKMSIQSLWHIHLSLHRTINLCAISEELNSKKFTKCQYNLCGIYIYLCAVLSISAHSPRNQTEKVHKMSIQSLRHTHLSLHRTINLGGIYRVKKFKICQYNS